ncbi:MAG: NUDIX domain-containing protein [Candidatus Sungbacteria bacterium]|nr:NUDIX domain-containing protein [Candidatus Sungbacteria bacterium]
MFQHPLNVVVGSLLKNGKCLLIRRNKEPYKNYWAIPGGKVEYGEHIADAIERELKEEIGVDVKFAGLRGIVSEVLRDSQNGEIGGHFLIWVCGVEFLSGEPAKQNEGEIKWFGPEDVEKEKAAIIPSDYLMAKRFIFGEVPAVSVHTVRVLSDDGGYRIEHTDL